MGSLAVAAAQINLRMGIAEWSMLIVLSILWGGSFFFVEIALTQLSPLSIVAFRVFVAAIVIWIFVLIKRYPIPRSAPIWIAFFWMAVVNNVIPFTLIAWGQKEIAAGLASILNSATPIFTVIAAGVFLKDEPITPSKVVGTVLGLAGVTVLIGPSAVAGLSSGLIAQLAVLTAAFSYAVAGVYGRRFRSMGVHPIVAAAGQLLASSVVMLPAAILIDRPYELSMPGVDVWAAVTALAVISTALAYVLYFTLLERAGATNLVLVTLLLPITAILLGYTFLGERLHALHFVGIAVIGLGLAAIDGRTWQWIRQS